mgnify:CR=1 FL=1
MFSEAVPLRLEPPRPPNYTRRVVIVFVDDFDLATLAAQVMMGQALGPVLAR